MQNADILRRQKANFKIIGKIAEVAADYPDLRWHQLLQVMNLEHPNEDEYYSESVCLLNDIKTSFDGEPRLPKNDETVKAVKEQIERIISDAHIPDCVSTVVGFSTDDKSYEFEGEGTINDKHVKITVKVGGYEKINEGE